MSKMKDTYKQIFGEDLKKESYKLIGHSFRLSSGIGKSVCTNCGLVALRNEFTDWSVRMGCMSADHPQYEPTRKRLSCFK